MSTSTVEPVLVSDVGSVRTVTLNNPGRLNAFNPAGFRALTKALDDAAADPTVAVVVIEGAGKAFSSGVDLRALSEPGADTADFGLAFAPLIVALVEFPKPLIAAVHGAAVGIGLTMLLFCDVVYVAEDARLRAPFTSLGTAPEAASSWMLPKVIGTQRASELLLTARWVSGVEAAEIGIAVAAVPVDQLQARVQESAAQIAGNVGPAVLAAKKLLRQGWVEEARAAVQREDDAARELIQQLGSFAKGALPN
ncbi:enoyl-CoA hydratase/isomerase family protein [Rhodococcus sp. ARC_M6]|uniref:enoyl-CoA hydratase/isomerase family protein n=1 Tax=Rhodococcus sp. ARC_M6 TaxID=2928852 RepID=UPI001FB40482|nr:enoyl-CoA hydratase/isomerase family protein [Rhodococcus sp. ARC_M6]MCJ0904118.1 enoyl-CoA hydratase/isomerase family protein [Rhodococcus sp. ARC_M6]